MINTIDIILDIDRQTRPAGLLSVMTALIVIVIKQTAISSDKINDMYLMFYILIVPHNPTVGFVPNLTGGAGSLQRYLQLAA